MENLNIDVSVDDGKYRFTQTADGGLEIFRYGTLWIEGSFKGSKMVIAMACELEEARNKIAKLESSNEALESLRPIWAQGWSTDSEAAQAAGNALSELWQLLAADNQTDAMETLRALKERDYQRLAGR